MHFAAVISAMGLRVYANKEREILILPTVMHYVCLAPVDQTHRSRLCIEDNSHARLTNPDNLFFNT